MSKDPIEVRLNKIKGQVEGIKEMYKEDPCDSVSIVDQLLAARAALEKVAVIILSQEAERCAEEGETKKLEEIVNKTFKSI